MAENENKDKNEPEVNESQGGRTFTQEEVNAIIADRLNRERSKYSDYDTLKTKAEQFDAAQEAEKTELQKETDRANALQAKLDAMNKATELRNIREKVSKDTGVPTDLLSGDTEEACSDQAKAILAFAKTGNYPKVKDGGETHPPVMTKEEILAIKDERKRIKAIEDNIDLFK